MEDTFFTVEEAASILGCDRATVYRIMANGWLSRPPGTTKRETGGRVTRKSLYQLLLIDRLSCLPPKTFIKLPVRRKVFEKSESQIANAKHLSISEERVIPAQAAPPDNGNRPDQSKRCLHHDFAEQHQFSLGWKARQLAPGDPSFQDDLIQEMSLAILEYDQPASFEFLFELATNHAKMYIRYEIARNMLRLGAARYARDRFAERMESLQALIDELIERGVPTEWIEEVLGERLDVA
ncbi:MAG TPA: hypothetical protein VEK08_26520 [Planctomycetota bacterium]|nr:hypothetical protein [Planctomycetota bacterium]